MQRALFWSSGSSCLVRWARNGSIHGAMTTIITWAEDVTSLADPPIMSECSVSGSAVGSGLLLLSSPSHTTDGLNSLSKKMFGGLHRVLRQCVPRHLPPDCF